jgi:hypothetical protein
LSTIPCFKVQAPRCVQGSGPPLCNFLLDLPDFLGRLPEPGDGLLPSRLISNLLGVFSLPPGLIAGLPCEGKVLFTAASAWM